jgi:hypothetical protein
MLNVGSQNENYTQGEVYMVSGRICREQAISALLRVLPTADSRPLVYLAIAFENTLSRNVVPPLISLLANPDAPVRDAEQALATRRSQYGIADADSARQSYDEWSNWGQRLQRLQRRGGGFVHGVSEFQQGGRRFVA